MPISVSHIRLPFTSPKEEAVAVALRKLSLPKSCNPHGEIAKQAVDARQREIIFEYTVRVETTASPEQEQAFVDKLGSNNIRYVSDSADTVPAYGALPLEHPIVIAGFGPAGMFAALRLISNGYRVIVLERGGTVEDRVSAVQQYWNGGTLNPNNNVQYGEGGAGTFSDGKLTTRISDPHCRYVLEQFVKFGAPKEILWQAKPHIGTDLLCGIVRRIREEIIALGGEIRFYSPLQDMTLKSNTLTSVTVGKEEIPAELLVLAVGHTAEDTYRMLYSHGVPIQPKPFSVGMRIEHLQSDIDRALYKKAAGHPALPQGSYQLSYRQNGRGVYTFCMCPGGVVVPSESSERTIVTNGMSNYARDGKNANAALVVSVSPSDFGEEAFDGFAFQKHLEETAYTLTGGKAVAATVGSFLFGEKPKLGRISPTYARGVELCSPERLFPSYITDFMKTGIRVFDRKLKGFAVKDAVLTGPETRTSSPVQIPRDLLLQADGFTGIYPCGEGPGQAGGIVSAAVDGLRVADSVISRYAPNK